jgi:phage baseplate assembly protein W
MPILNSTRRISPLDINKNVSIGVAFPLDDNNMFKGTQTLKEQVKSNLLNLLLTEQGERVNEPNFGVGLKHHLFEQNIDIDSLNTEINAQINFYIPEISLIDTDINFLEDEHLLFIKITYSINSDNTVDAIQLNFNQ